MEVSKKHFTEHFCRNLSTDSVMRLEAVSLIFHFGAHFLAMPKLYKSSIPCSLQSAVLMASVRELQALLIDVTDRVPGLQCQHNLIDLVIPSREKEKDVLDGVQKLRLLLDKFGDSLSWPKREKVMKLVIKSNRPSLALVLLEKYGFELANYKNFLHIVGNRHLVARALIRYKANPNAINEKFQTALHVACRDGFLNTAKEIIGADPNAFDKHGYTALHYACKGVHRHVIQWLVTKAGAHRNLWCKESFYELALQHDVQYGLPPDRGGISMDEFMEGLGFDTRFARMIDMEDNSSSMPYIHQLVYHYQEQHQDRYLAAIEKCVKKDPSLLDVRDSFGGTILHSAALESPALVEKILKLGADPGALDNFGRTPLLWATVYQHEKNVECLLKATAGRSGLVDIRDNHGWTALHWAAFYRNTKDLAKLLLKYGADCNVVDLDGRLPLHLGGYPFSVADITKQKHNYGPWDVTRVLRNDPCPFWLDGNEMAESEWFHEMVNKTQDVTLRDKDGNLPFFLSACSSHLTETFVIVSAAATQGLLDDLCSAMGQPKKESRTVELSEKDETGLEQRPAKRKRWD